MKKFFFLVLSVLALGVCTAQAQRTYRSAVGLNLGLPLGANYKQFLGEASAIEATLGYIRDGVMITALYEYHVNLVDNFNFYFGGGVNMGGVGLSGNGRFALGVTPVVGFEYKFDGAPIALATDYSPQLNVFSPINLAVGAFKIRFVF